MMEIPEQLEGIRQSYVRLIPPVTPLGVELFLDWGGPPQLEQAHKQLELVYGMVAALYAHLGAKVMTPSKEEENPNKQEGDLL